jgi:hypothetical protein
MRQTQLLKLSARQIQAIQPVEALRGPCGVQGFSLPRTPERPSVTYRHSYVVHARRRDKWWELSVPEADRAFTLVKRLSQAEAMARKVIALVLDVPENSFDVIVNPDPTEQTGLRPGTTR